MSDTTTRPDPAPASDPARPETDDLPDGVAIRVTGFGKRYGDVRILADVDVEVATGTNLVVVGQSGCGKSTLLRHIAAIESIDSGPVDGSIEIAGLGNVGRLSEKDLTRRRIRGLELGYVFQEGALFDFCSVQENLAWPLVTHRPELSDDEVRERVETVLGLVEMSGVPGILAKKPSELSGGQKKRIALARTLMLEPRVLLYDEPTAGLDPPIAAGISRLIRRLQEERSLTGVTATHDMACAEVTADRLVYLADKGIAFSGTFAEAVAHERVQAFMSG